MTTDTKPYHLYRVLGVAKECTTEEITRAYRRLALQYHPDRNPDGTEKFKSLSNAYAVLSDADRRAVYDLTGFLSEGASGGDAAANISDAAARQQRSAELADQVRDFFAAYAGSAEETTDVVKGYVKCAGNFKKMVREYLLFDNGVEGEIQRLHRLVQRLITAGTLTATPAWTESTTTRSILKLEKSMRREREEAEEALKELAGAGEGEDGGLGALQLAMQQRQAASYRSMLDNLEAKYVAKKRPEGNSEKRSSRTGGEEGDEGGDRKRRRAEKTQDRRGAPHKAKRT